MKLFHMQGIPDKIPGRWIDLDHILYIGDVVTHSMPPNKDFYRYAFHIQFMFQDTARVFELKDEWLLRMHDGGSMTSEYIHPSSEHIEQLKAMHASVLEAWSTK